ncbi:MAG: exonuclease SbcCD subunit D [Treponemataceae bacterium]|nr:MAG: exonuclease SbcCD subunit D [Treponemataceae bacterium]
MKCLHLSDLHLGKSVHEFSLIEDQEYILRKILGIADDEKPECILISGDIFDRSIASTEALHLFDDFLVELSKRNIPVFIISGNHDSADRLSFGSRLIAGSGIHIAPVYDGKIARYTIADEFGDVDMYLLPFLKPSLVKRYFPDEQIESWTDALNVVIKNIPVNTKNRNILLSHQFVTGAFRTESEEVSVGGADNVDARVFSPFDYVALGHLHGAQSVERDTIRYCGTPLKYSFSEANQNKSVTVVTFAQKGSISITEAPLTPKRDMREIRGTYLEVSAKNFYRDFNLDDYYRITLMDEDDQPDAISKLRTIYPHLMRLDYDNKRTQSESDLTGSVDASKFTPLELFETLYREQNHQELSDVQKSYLTDAIDSAWGEAQ